MGKTEQTDVCLVMPPVVYDCMPSLALGILKSCLNQAGISSCVDYANMYFSFAIGKNAASMLYHGSMTEFISEYIFNIPAGIENTYSDEEFIRMHLGDRYSARAHLYTESLIRHARKVAEEEIERTADRILAHKPKAVGCTAVFQQRNAGLAILRKVKEKCPEISTFMGGYTCFGAAGIAMLKQFPFLDYIFMGESDDIFADTMNMILAGDTRHLPYGVLKNGDPFPEIPPHRIVENMDLVPAPDYDDFFEMMKRPEGMYMLQTYNRRVAVRLLIESSRGCWWGDKHPCSFCGLNGPCRRYRMKSPGKFLSEIKELTEKYGCTYYCIADNILPNEWFKDVLPHLSETGIRFTFTAEVKANLLPKQVKLLKDAGYVVLQPGIESLSDHILNLLDKGVTGVNNVALLKYAKENGLFVLWNILTGVPGETPEDYQSQTELFPLLEHLQPPKNDFDIIYMRDSVYQRYPEKFGLDLEPAVAFRYISPSDDSFVNAIAFNFTDKNHTVQKNSYTVLEKVRMRQVLSVWNASFEKKREHIRLDGFDDGEKLWITDTRSISGRRKLVLEGIKRKIYLFAHEPVKKEKLQVLLPECSLEEIEVSLEELCREKLMIFLSGHFLALAVMTDKADSQVLDWREYAAEQGIPNDDCPESEEYLEKLVSDGFGKGYFFDVDTVRNTLLIPVRNDLDFTDNFVG